MRNGDRVGIWLSLDKNVAKLYINGRDQKREINITDVFDDKVYFYVMFRTNKISVEVTSRKIGFPP